MASRKTSVDLPKRPANADGLPRRGMAVTASGQARRGVRFVAKPHQSEGLVWRGQNCRCVRKNCPSGDEDGNGKVQGEGQGEGSKQFETSNVQP